MTAIDPGQRTATVARPQTKGQIIVRYITTTDHKVIGNLYLDHVVRASSSSAD